MGDRAWPVSPRWVPYYLTASGLLLAGVHLLEVAAVAVGPQNPVPPFVAGILTSAPFALFLVAGGYRLRESDIARDRYHRIAGWSLAGLVFLGAFFAIIAAFTFEDWLVRLGTVRWGLSVGAGGGALVGYFNARAIERAVAAERIRAEENERRRELLDYLNALLRHEVLNTATAIGGYADLLDSPGVADEDRRQYAGNIREQVDELTRVTEDVQLLLDAEGTGGERPVDLAGVLRSELDTLDERVGDVEVDADLPEGVAVLADDLCPQLFRTLLSSAVKRTDAGPLQLGVTARVDGDSVSVRVSDDGTPIPDPERGDLFEPTTGPSTGTDHGLDLVVVDRLADRYGGTVELVESGPDGTEFVVELPRATGNGND